ncbi:hypothetical protein FGIG_05008 [Fasciola gigantica]|uniref:Uncharacterized protein n=1 Tax=Fasciola gigantica TaxID=46835 RepID=A0A504YB64_FASGI|nr:hypothetical protein FGIG_05008 [Fasciola gigantica]
MTSCAEHKACTSIALEMTGKRDAHLSKGLRYTKPTTQSSGSSKCQQPARVLNKNETNKPDQCDYSRSRMLRKPAGKNLLIDSHLHRPTSITQEPSMRRTNSVMSTKLDGCWSFGARSMPLPPLNRKTPVSPLDSPELGPNTRSDEHVWSNLWHSGQPCGRPWQIWGNCANMSVCAVPGGWNDAFAKDLPSFYLFNMLGGNLTKPNSITSQHGEVPRYSEPRSTKRDMRRNTTRAEDMRPFSPSCPQAVVNRVPGLQVKQLTLEQGRSSATEVTSRSKLGPKWNSTDHTDSDSIKVDYPDPRTGASLEYLARLSELLNLEETTKRCERIRWRRRFKKRTPSNGTISATGDT